MSDEKLRVFIGSGEASVLERKTLIYSIKKNSRSSVELIVFNGTHNAIERENGPPEPVPMSLRVKYRNITEFSNYRFMIPELCGFSGRAVWVDSDMICFGDIGELFDVPMDDVDVLAKASPYGHERDKWGLSVSVFACDRCRFDLEQYFDEIDQGQYGYNDLHQLARPFLAKHPFRVGEIDPQWNVFDYYDGKTKLIHYTNLYSQPWKFRGHPYGDIWFQYFREAREAGFITDADIDLSIRRGYVRPDLLEGNALGFGGFFKHTLSELKATARRQLSAIRR